MTKAELIAQLSGIADDTNVFIQSWPEDGPDPEPGDLYELQSVENHEKDGDDGKPFTVLVPAIEFAGGLVS